MYGYNFYFSDNGDVMTFPITPSEVSINVGSNNKVINLINGGDINLLKSPSLIEIEFDARFPMRKYPYARDYQSFDTYYSKIKDLKANKKPFMFYITRSTPNKARTWDTELQVVIEEFKIKEDANEGDDVIISFKLKQYKTYGVKTVTNGVIGGNSRDSGSQATTNQPYTIQKGDSLFTIAKKFYGDGSLYSKIYQYNKNVIEAKAKQQGRESSCSGSYLYYGTQIIIPAK